MNEKARILLRRLLLDAYVPKGASKEFERGATYLQKELFERLGRSGNSQGEN